MARQKPEKVNKAKAERELYFAMMGEESPCSYLTEEDADISQEIENCDENLWIYQDMLQRAINANDHEDAKHLRRVLQELKEEKRRLVQCLNKGEGELLVG